MPRLANTSSRAARALPCLLLGRAPFAGSANVADAEAGTELAGQRAACHGAAGVSTSDEIPNLAAQKSPYPSKQLEAFRASERLER